MVASKGLPTAQEMMEKLALAEAQKASEAARKHAAVEAEKKALLDNLTKPSKVSEEERMKAPQRSLSARWRTASPRCCR